MRRTVLLVPAVALLLAACSDGGADPPTTTFLATVATASTTVVIPSPDEIMADGRVTDEERELARRAVFECITAAGADTTFELFDLDPVVQRDYPEEYQNCLWDYAGLSRRNEPLPGDFDLGLLGVVECTEDLTGRDYGSKTVDEIGRLTAESHRTIQNAIDTDQASYDRCYAELRSDDAVFGIIGAMGYRVDEGIRDGSSS